MSNIQAAIGCGQIERVEEIVKKKIKILNIYKNALLEFPSISMDPNKKYYKWCMDAYGSFF